MTFEPGGKEYPITWYKAPAGAKNFPTHHRFGTADWDDHGRPIPWSGIGEKPGTRKWTNGENIYGTTGQCYRGNLSVFQHGLTDDNRKLTDDFPKCASCPRRGARWVFNSITGQHYYAMYVRNNFECYPATLVLDIGGDTGGFDGSYQLGLDHIGNYWFWLWQDPLDIGREIVFEPFAPINGFNISTIYIGDIYHSGPFFNNPFDFFHTVSPADNSALSVGASIHLHQSFANAFYHTRSGPTLKLRVKNNLPLRSHSKVRCALSISDEVGISTLPEFTNDFNDDYRS